MQEGHVCVERLIRRKKSHSGKLSLNCMFSPSAQVAVSDNLK